MAQLHRHLEEKSGLLFTLFLYMDADDFPGNTNYNSYNSLTFVFFFQFILSPRKENNIHTNTGFPHLF